MLPHTRCFTRDGCIVGARLVTYQQLEENYVCRECGGIPVIKAHTADLGSTEWWAECGKCGHRDFISRRFYIQQCADFKTILWKLPEQLKVLVKPQKETITMDQAIADLFG